MSETTIKCPKCEADIPLTESLAAPLISETRASEKISRPSCRLPAVHLSQRRSWFDPRLLVHAKKLPDCRTFEWTSTAKEASMLASLVA